MKGIAPPHLSGTVRIDAFSDGVIAIIAPLRILTLRIPHVDSVSSATLLRAMGALLLRFLNFTVIVITVAIFGVNHHPFLHRIERSDWKLMWLNNLLLFWFSVVPFATASLGDHPGRPFIISLYALNLSLASMAFTWMEHYAFFRGALVMPEVPMTSRRLEWRRSLFVGVAPASVAVIAFLHGGASKALLAILPLLNVDPRLVSAEPGDSEQSPQRVASAPPMLHIVR